jgi:hypothetical protein
MTAAIASMIGSAWRRAEDQASAPKVTAAAMKPARVDGLATTAAAA